MSPLSSLHCAPAVEPISNETLGVLAREGRPMTADELIGTGGLAAEQVSLQLSVARIAGLVRALPGTSGGEPVYAMTTLGLTLAGRFSGRLARAV